MNKVFGQWMSMAEQQRQMTDGGPARLPFASLHALIRYARSEHKYIAYQAPSGSCRPGFNGRFILTLGGDATGLAVAAAGTYCDTDAQTRADGDYLIFDVPEEIYYWMAFGSDCPAGPVPAAREQANAVEADDATSDSVPAPTD